MPFFSTLWLFEYPLSFFPLSQILGACNDKLQICNKMKKIRIPAHFATGNSSMCMGVVRSFVRPLRTQYTFFKPSRAIVVTIWRIPRARSGLPRLILSAPPLLPIPFLLSLILCYLAINRYRNVFLEIYKARFPRRVNLRPGRIPDIRPINLSLQSHEIICVCYNALLRQRSGYPFHP